jgi:hypothetical protein
MIRPIISYLFFLGDLIRGRYKSTNGREERLLAHVCATAPAGDAAAVLSAIDSYGENSTVGIP